MDSQRPTGFSRLPADSAVYVGRIRAVVRHWRAAFLVFSAALLWKSLFLGEDDHATSCGRQYRHIPPNDRPPTNRMGRGADPTDPGPNGRNDLPRFVGGDHYSRTADGLLLIRVSYYVGPPLPLLSMDRTNPARPWDPGIQVDFHALRGRSPLGLDRASGYCSAS